MHVDIRPVVAPSESPNPAGLDAAPQGAFHSKRSDHSAGLKNQVHEGREHQKHIRRIPPKSYTFPRVSKPWPAPGRDSDLEVDPLSVTRITCSPELGDASSQHFAFSGWVRIRFLKRLKIRTQSVSPNALSGMRGGLSNHGKVLKIVTPNEITRCSSADGGSSGGLSVASRETPHSPLMGVTSSFTQEMKRWAA